MNALSFRKIAIRKIPEKGSIISFENITTVTANALVLSVDRVSQTAEIIYNWGKRTTIPWKDIKKVLKKEEILDRISYSIRMNEELGRPEIVYDKFPKVSGFYRGQVLGTNAMDYKSKLLLRDDDTDQTIKERFYRASFYQFTYFQHPDSPIPESESYDFTIDTTSTRSLEDNPVLQELAQVNDKGIPFEDPPQIEHEALLKAAEGDEIPEDAYKDAQYDISKNEDGNFVIKYNHEDYQGEFILTDEEFQAVDTDRQLKLYIHENLPRTGEALAEYAVLKYTDFESDVDEIKEEASGELYKILLENGDQYLVITEDGDALESYCKQQARSSMESDEYAYQTTLKNHWTPDRLWWQEYFQGFEASDLEDIDRRISSKEDDVKYYDREIEEWSEKVTQFTADLQQKNQLMVQKKEQSAGAKPEDLIWQEIAELQEEINDLNEELQEAKDEKVYSEDQRQDEINEMNEIGEEKEVVEAKWEKELDDMMEDTDKAWDILEGEFGYEPQDILNRHGTVNWDEAADDVITDEGTIGWLEYWNSDASFYAGEKGTQIAKVSS